MENLPDLLKNQNLVALVSDYWIFLLLVYGILKAIFPNWEALKRIGMAISDVMPFTKKGPGSSEK